MAIVATKLASENDYAHDSAGFTIGGIGTYDPDSEYWVIVQVDDGTEPAATISDQGSGVWSEEYYDAAEVTGIKAKAFRLTSGTPSGNVSVAFGGGGADLPHAALLKITPTEGSVLSFVGFIPGVDDSEYFFEVSEHSLDTSGAASGAAVVAVNPSRSTGTSSPETGWTELHDFHDADNSGMAIQFSATNAGDEAVFTHTSGPVGFTFGLEFTDAAVGVEVAAEAGSYAVAGADATLLETKALDAAAGAYAVTGADAGFEYTIPLNAEAGAYAITGAAAALLQTSALAAEAGSYAVTGADAGLSVAQGFEIDAAPGSYIVSGAETTFLFSRALAADPGSYSVGGQAAGLFVTQPGSVLHLRHQITRGVVSAEDLEAGILIPASGPAAVEGSETGVDETGAILHLRHMVAAGAVEAEDFGW